MGQFMIDDTVTLAMHIPDNFIAPQFDAVLFAIMIPVWGICMRNLITHTDAKNITTLGAGSAFSFLVMMFNVPVPGGTTAHAIGGALIAILIGPRNACIAISMALLLQALLFGDGGIIAYGANCFNMAFVLPFSAYAVYRIICGIVSSDWGEKVARGLAGYVGVNLAALCTAVELGLQPVLYRTNSGQALYFPYPMSISIPAMMIPHLLVVGVIEAAITVVVVEYVRRSAPEIVFDFDTNVYRRHMDVHWNGNIKRGIRIVLLCMVLLTPLGLLPGGGAWGEWNIDTFGQDAGLSYVPKGIANGFSFHSLLADYSLKGLPVAVGYVISAVIGLSVLTIIFRLLGQLVMRTRRNRLNRE